jgi:hypothetical protein
VDEDPPKLDLKQEQQKIVRNSALAFVIAVGVFLTAFFLLPRMIELGGEDLESRLKFWAGANLPVLLWLMYSVRLVSNGRFHSREDNRGSAYAPPSSKIAVPVANLQNTLEQTFLFIFSQLGLVLLLKASALPLIAASALLFMLGRLAFLHAYPSGAGARAFGMALTALPILFATLLSVIAVSVRIFH